MATVVNLPRDTRGDATVEMIENIFEQRKEKKRQQDIAQALEGYQLDLSNATTAEEVKSVVPLSQRLNPEHLGDIQGLANISQLENQYKQNAISRVNPGNQTVYRVGDTGGIESQNIRADAAIPQGYYPSDVFNAVLTHNQSKGIAANTNATVQGTQQDAIMFPELLRAQQAESDVAQGTIESRISQSIANLGLTSEQVRGAKSSNRVSERTEDFQVGQAATNFGSTRAAQAAQELANQETRATQKRRIERTNVENDVARTTAERRELAEIAGLDVNNAAIAANIAISGEQEKRDNEVHNATIGTLKERTQAKLDYDKAAVALTKAQTATQKTTAEKLKAEAEGNFIDKSTATERAMMTQLSAWGVTPTEPSNMAYIRDLYEAEKTIDESFSASTVALDQAALAKARAALRLRAKVEIQKPDNQRVPIAEIQARVLQNSNDVGEVQVTVPLPEGGTYTVDPQGGVQAIKTVEDPDAINAILQEELTKGLKAGLGAPELISLTEQLINQSPVAAYDRQQRVTLTQRLFQAIAEKDPDVYTGEAQ